MAEGPAGRPSTRTVSIGSEPDHKEAAPWRSATTATLHILAFDHRGSFQKKFFGVQGEPNEQETATIADAKGVIYEGMLAALAEGAPRDSAGVLVDEQFGAEIARKAKAEGLKLAMPVEKSGQNEFDFQFGEDFGEHITEFDPSFSKVLVRFNPEGDAEMNDRQAERLKRLGDWLHANDRKYLFELLVPAEPHQLEAVGGDESRFDLEVRPALMRARDRRAAGGRHRARHLEDRGPRPARGLRDDLRAGPQRAGPRGRGVRGPRTGRRRRRGRSIGCEPAAGVPGYVGFAIGRSIWWNPLKGYVDGTTPREDAARQIGENYRRFIGVYEGV